MYDFPLVINTNLPLILHRFRDIAVDRSEIAIYLATPLVFNSPRRRGSPGTISVKFSVDVNGWPIKVPNAENLNRLSRAHERYTLQTTDRQTDRRTGDSK